MRGEPKWLNIRQDVLNWQAACGAENEPEKFKSAMQKLYDARMIWVITAANIEGEGVTDITHKVIEHRDIETGVTERCQQELQVDPNAAVFRRLGFTDAECRAMLEMG